MNKELLKELEDKFQIMQRDLGIKSSLEELDEIFFIKDHILKEGFVSNNLSRQICSRIVETYMSWTNYLHSLVVPNPQNILNISEAKLFDSEEKKIINDLMKKTMKLNSRNNLICLTKDKKEESEFIDDAIREWRENFNRKLIQIINKIKEGWEK